MKKKLFTLLLGSLLSLTACGGGSEPTKHEVDQFLPSDDPSSTKTIKFWHCLGQAKTDNLERVVTEFNRIYRNKYKVVLDPLAGDYSSLSSDVKTKLQAGSVPAMTMGYPDTFADLITNTIEYSAILRLDNFINDETFGYEVDSETGIAEDFVPGYYVEGQGYQFPGTWSMPMYKSTEILYYNQSYFCGDNPMNRAKFGDDSEWQILLAKATKLSGNPTLYTDLQNLYNYAKGHDGYVYDVPTTWQEMKATANRILEEYRGDQSGFYPLGYDSDANLMISQLEQRGFAYTTNENIVEEKDHYLFGNEQNKQNTVDLVTEIMDMIKGKNGNGKILKTKYSNGGKYSSDDFKKIKCVMTVGSTGGSTYQKSKSFVTGLAEVPCYEDDQGVKHKAFIQQGPSVCFFDNKDPYIHKGAWLFYKMMADPEWNVELALDNSYDPIRISSYDTDYYNEYIESAGKNLGLEYDIPNITRTLKQYYMTSPVFKGSSTARDQIGMIISYCYANGKTPAEAVKRAYKECY